jgi:hypothetical protein
MSSPERQATDPVTDDLAVVHESAWLSEAAVSALHRALRSVVGPDAAIEIVGDAPRWQALVGHDRRVDRADQVVVVPSPRWLPATPQDDAGFVEQLVDGAGAVLLATVSPASATSSPGRWPAYWSDLFATHAWRFADRIRPVIWDDPSIGPDVKEGALLFVDPETWPHLVASLPEAKLHPHRLVTALRATHAAIDRVRDEVVERDRVATQARTDEMRALHETIEELRAALDARRVEHEQLAARLAAAERRTGLLTDHLLLGARRPANVPARSSRLPLKRSAAPEPPVVADRPDPVVVDLFDPTFYCDHTPDAQDAPLEHYLEIGESEGRRPNPWFDPAYYRRANPDVVASGAGALVHYARHGGLEGRAASAEFDTEWYVRAHPEVAQSGLHPMVHFLAVGQQRGWSTAPPVAAR